MCIIAVKPAGISMPTEETIRTMWQQNPDGAGYMYAIDGRVHIEKGFMKLKHLEDSLDELSQLTDIAELSLVLHFRIGTSGGNTPENTHPFPVTDQLEALKEPVVDCDLGVVHNGIIPIEPRSKDISDTMEYILARLSLVHRLDPTFYEDKMVLEYIEKQTGSKLALMCPDGSVYTVGKFFAEDGIKYSNYGFIPWTGFDEQVSHGGYWSWLTRDDDNKWGHNWSPNSYTRSSSQQYRISGKGKTERMVWLDPEIEFVALDDGSMADADDFLMDADHNIYTYDLDWGWAVLLPNARVIPIGSKTTRFAKEDSDVFELAY